MNTTVQNSICSTYSHAKYLDGRRNKDALVCLLHWQSLRPIKNGQPIAYIDELNQLSHEGWVALFINY